MNCTWGYTWYGRYLYHNWLFWLLVIVAASVLSVFLLNQLRSVRQKRCPGCNNPVEPVYLRCPECGRELKSHCPGCHHIVDKSWQFCPHCKQALHFGVQYEATKVDS